MKVLRIQPKKYPEVIEIDGSLESLQKEVAGPIQAVYPWDDPVALICNEEGKLIGVSFNRTLMDADGTPTDVIAGTFLIVGLTEDDFGDLSQEYIDKPDPPEAQALYLNKQRRKHYGRTESERNRGLYG